jgi:acetyl esterase
LNLKAKELLSMRLLLSVMVLMCGVVPVAAQEKGRGSNQRVYPPKMDGCSQKTYKTVGDVKLDLWIFRPEKREPAPAIVFFFGGGWQSGTPQQFEDQCRQLAKRGMVAITADYRVASRHQVKPVQCVADARSAIRWVRAHSEELGIDPNRIAAAGGSAGGHLAACTAFVDSLDEKGEDSQISAVPNALVLFNPALVLAPIEGYELEGFGTRVPAERMGTKPIDISPVHHITDNAPPTIIFHGREDTTVPYASAEAFVKKMKMLGNQCELKGYDKQKHGFFNSGEFKKQTLAETDKFFVSLGWISP